VNAAMRWTCDSLRMICPLSQRVGSRQDARILAARGVISHCS
jgi:hypothetical protein